MRLWRWATVERGAFSASHGIRFMAEGLLVTWAARAAWAHWGGFHGTGYAGMAAIPAVMLRAWSVGCAPPRAAEYLAAAALLCAFAPFPSTPWMLAGLCLSITLFALSVRSAFASPHGGGG